MGTGAPSICCPGLQQQTSRAGPLPPSQAFPWHLSKTKPLVETRLSGEGEGQTSVDPNRRQLDPNCFQLDPNRRQWDPS